MNTKPILNNRSRQRSSYPATSAVNLFAAAFLLSPWSLRAGGVVTSCTEASLRAAMAGGGTVTFACDGTITLASTITLGVNLTLDGRGHHVAISGNNAVQLLYVPTNISLTLLNLAFTNGLSTNGGALFNAGGTVNATNCNFTGNRAVGPDGKGIGANGTNAAGGAVYNTGTFFACQCTFVQNAAQGGNGADGNPNATPSPPLAGVGGWARGGALCNMGVAILDRSLFANNSAHGGSAGAGSGGNYSYPSYATLGGQGGAGVGGAVYSGPAITFVNCTVVGNSGTGGSGGNGGYQIGPWPPIRFGPSGGGGGTGIGGIESGALWMTNCTIAGNSGHGGAGGAGGFSSLYSGPGGMGGTAIGGIETSGGLINTILAANSGIGGAGGYGCWDTGNPPITCRYAGNSGVYTNLHAGSAADLGHNISSDWSLNNLTSLNSIDPNLGDLADNGGPTLTKALLPGSLAIDAGDPAAAPPVDERGAPRPVGSAADIGAFEYGSPALLHISDLGGGPVYLFVLSSPNQSCRLLVSSNLSDWFAIATNPIGADGTTQFYDDSSSGGPCRFYRIAVP